MSKKSPGLKETFKQEAKIIFWDASVILCASLCLWTVVVSSLLWCNISITPDSAAVVVMGGSGPGSINVYTAQANNQGRSTLS